MTAVIIFAVHDITRRAFAENLFSSFGAKPYQATGTKWYKYFFFPRVLFVICVRFGDKLLQLKSCFSHRGDNSSFWFQTSLDTDGISGWMNYDVVKIRRRLINAKQCLVINDDQARVESRSW